MRLLIAAAEAAVTIVAAELGAMIKHAVADD
jgi:hypothetical protein